MMTMKGISYLRILKQHYHLKSLHSLRYSFASKRVIVDLKKFRETNSQPNNINEQIQSSEPIKNVGFKSNSQTKAESTQQVTSKTIEAGSVKKEQIQQKMQQHQSSNQRQSSNTQATVNTNSGSNSNNNSKEIRSRQLSCEIMRCSQERELWQLYPKCHETQHLVMLFYSMLRLRKFKVIFNSHKQKINGNNTLSKEDSINTINSLWENKKFLDLVERISENLDDMNPDSLNLILRAIRLKKFAGGVSTIPAELFVNVFNLLAKDKNILLFNEIQLFHFLKNLSDMKSTLMKYGDTKTNSKVVQLAMNKLAPSLMQFKRTQLLSLTIVSLNLELFDSSFHLKLNQAVLKRFVYLNSTDFTLLFQYNTLHYLQMSNKKHNADKEQEKIDILNRVLAYMEKGDIFSKMNIKNLLKFCAFFNQLDFHPTIEGIVHKKLSVLIPQRLSELITVAQQLKNLPYRDAPTQLRDAFGYLLRNPQIFLGSDQGSQIFHSLRAFVALENIGYENLMHVSHFLIECILKVEEEEIQIQDFTLDSSNILVKTLEMAIQKINVQFSLTKPENLEEIFELLYKLEDNLKVKYALNDGTQEDLNKILLKATKYVCQVTHKLGASVIIKIGIQLRELLSESTAAEQRFKKYLQRYGLSEVFTKYEEAVRFAEIKQKFNEQQFQESQLDDPGIDQLEFSQDIEKIEEQLRDRAKERHNKITSSQSNFINALELPSLNVIDKYPKYHEFQEAVKRQTHCVNALLLSLLAFSDSTLKIQDLEMYRPTIQLLKQQFIGPLLTIDNVNNLIMIQQLFLLNELDIFKECPEIAELADKRIKTLKQHFETRKKSTKQKVIEFINQNNQEQIKSIEECVDFHHCLIDIVVHTNTNKKIAVIATAKPFDSAEIGRGFDTKENKMAYLTDIRLKYLKAAGFDQVYAVDNNGTFNISI